MAVIDHISAPTGRPLVREETESPNGSVAAYAAPKYRAFISYSHRDTAWAKWLHRALEGYRIDKDLIGRETAAGPVPKSLRPIFRDREDFAAGHSLTDQTLAAIQASQFLIAICSPNAAKSKYVNEEIRYFKALGRASRVIPIIVNGEPGECFPAALRSAVATDGTLTDLHEEPLAADARPHKDGKELAKQKVVAGLLGVPLDEVSRRAERARKRQSGVRLGIAITAGLLLSGAGVGWWGAHKFYGQLRSEEDVNSARDAADVCERAGALPAAEVWRIKIALSCVQTFSEVLADTPAGRRLPQRVLALFEANLTILRQFNEESKLTPEQASLLVEAEVLLARLSQ